MLGETLLGKYRVTRLLDEGGMSKIYLATRAGGREVVVKVLKDHLRGQAKAVEHFRREIHIMSRFQHPHSVAVHDSATRGPQGPLLVMEYLRGADLNVLLHRDGRFSVERTGRLLAQLCEVLQAAHDQGIVHRDLKPANLMVLNPGTPQETLKLMDFGLAKMTSMLYISPEELVDFSLPPASGTPEYISPEMVRGFEMDGRGDLYSVGVLLYELLTGRRPFQHQTVEQLMVAHAGERPPTFTEIGLTDRVPPAVEAVVLHCLAKTPDQRPASAAQLLVEYERALGRRLGAVCRPTPTVGTNGPVPPKTPPTAPPVAPPAPVDRNAFQHCVEATMPEVMALFKLKGFVSDLGGEVLESIPGMIKVRLGSAPEKKVGLLARVIGQSGAHRLQAAQATEIELHMQRPDPGQPNKLSITLIMRPVGGLATPDWKARCGQISRDLQAYLMGR